MELVLTVLQQKWTSGWWNCTLFPTYGNDSYPRLFLPGDLVKRDCAVVVQKRFKYLWWKSYLFAFILISLFILHLFVWINRLAPLKSACPKTSNCREQAKNKQGYRHTPNSIKRTLTPVLGHRLRMLSKRWGQYFELVVTKQQEEEVVVLGTSGRGADFVMAGGEGNCAHEHHALSDGYFWLPHILISFPFTSDTRTNVFWTQRSV